MPSGNPLLFTAEADGSLQRDYYVIGITASNLSSTLKGSDSWGNAVGNLKIASVTALLAGLLTVGSRLGNAQAGEPTGSATDGDPSRPEIVTGEAFSAVKYTRTVQVQPNGKRLITSEGHHVLMARDSSGKIYMAGGDDAAGTQNCDLPTLGKLPPCDAWNNFLFDPTKGTMTHWMEGERGGKDQYVLVKLSDGQIAEAERLTSALEESGTKPAGDEPGITVQNLGERLIGGVKASGVRTTVTHSGFGASPATTIHEVWTSAKMRLVLRVVDGDPHGEETVSGLNHISLAPDAALFQAPTERILRQPKESGYAIEDMNDLSGWLVK